MNPDNTPQPPFVPPVNVSNKRSMFDGRVNRLGFFLGHAIIYSGLLAIILLYATVNFFIASTMQTNSFDSPNPVRSILNVGLFVVAIIYLIFMTFAFISLYIRRLHDINQTGWLSVLLIISPANLILYVVLQAVEGNEGPNKYGPQERPSTIASIIGWRR